MPGTHNIFYGENVPVFLERIFPSDVPVSQPLTAFQHLTLPEAKQFPGTILLPSLRELCRAQHSEMPKASLSFPIITSLTLKDMENYCKVIKKHNFQLTAYSGGGKFSIHPVETIICRISRISAGSLIMKVLPIYM